MSNIVISEEEAKGMSNSDLLNRIYEEAKMLVSCRDYGLERSKSIFLNNIDLLSIERHARALNSYSDINDELKNKIADMKKGLFGE